MLTLPSLERAAGMVNLRIHRGTQLPPDVVLKIELEREGATYDELGVPTDWYISGRDGEIWEFRPFTSGPVLRQYMSTGRVELIGG